jgi:hypothetical protein
VRHYWRDGVRVPAFSLRAFLDRAFESVRLQWFPLFFWGFFDLLLYMLNEIKFCIQGDEPTGKKSAILKAGIGLGLIALTSQYYLYMTILIAVFIFAVYVLFINRSLLKQKSFWQGG